MPTGGDLATGIVVHQPPALIAGQCAAHRLGSLCERNHFGERRIGHPRQWDGITNARLILHCQDGLASAAEPRAIRHHRHQSGQIDLERQGADRSTMVQQRCDDEGGNRIAGWRVGRESAQIDVQKGHGLAKAGGQPALAIRTIQQVGTQIGLGAQREDDIALVVDQQYVMVFALFAQCREWRAVMRGRVAGRGEAAAAKVRGECRQGRAHLILAGE